jgi:excisionase family DNA binding protein
MLHKRSYRVDEAAREINVSRRTVYRMIDRGDLHAVKIGRLTRIHYQQIELVLNNQCPTVPGRDSDQD